MYITNQIDLSKRDGKEIRKYNSSNKEVCMDSRNPIVYSEIRPYIRDDKKKLEEAWKFWRNFTLAKQREKERDSMEYKIEAFFTRIQERVEFENLVKRKSPGKNIKHFKTSKKPNENLKERMRPNENMDEREGNLMEKDVKKESNAKEIMREIKTSQEESYERLLTFERGGKNERSKVLKILANVSKNVDKTPINFPIPKFLLRMEKRREARRNNIQERKKKEEEERKNDLKEKEKEIKAIEVFSKRKKIQELNERKKEIIKVKLAEIHYERILLRRYGLRPWLFLMNLRNLQHLRSLNFFKHRVMRLVFTTWKIFVRDQLEEKQIKITNIYHNILQINCFKVWKKTREERIKQYQTATDLYEFKITEKIFTKWLKFIQEEQLNYFQKTQTADLHYTKKLKLTFMRKWKNYPKIQRQETAKEERKQIWRQKVKQILPDYEPVRVSNKF